MTGTVFNIKSADLLCSCLYQPAPIAYSKFISLWPDLTSLVCPNISSFQLQFLLPNSFHVLWFHFLRQYDYPDLPLRTKLLRGLVFVLVPIWSGITVLVNCEMESHGLHRISSLTRAEDSLLQEGALVITGILKLCPAGNVR